MKESSDQHMQPEDLIQKNQDMVMLSTIGQKITLCLNVSDINDVIYDSLTKIMKLDGFGIGIYDPLTNTISFPGYIEEGVKYKASVYDASDLNRLAPLCFSKNMEIITNDYSQDYKKYFSNSQAPIIGKQVQSVIYLPLSLNSKKVGVITIQGFEKNMFSEYHLNILRNIGIYGAIALENASLYHNMEMEVQARTIEIVNQKNIIESKQKEIIDSINYAKRIQYALLANTDFLKEHLNDHFILFKPKDIVSGDFYWASEHHDKFYFAVCDSTGHGVPGAFMSLLNIGYLNEAIKEKNIAEPNKVFDYVRKRLIENISQDGQQDGMDAVLVCVDKKTKAITYSAAHNTPLLISNHTFVELKKDKMPVGKGENETAFTSYSLSYKTGDILYLYTDGFADQFGGPMGKKFKYKKLNELLLNISGSPLAEQNAKLESEFLNWKGSLEQVDDVCIIGIRL